MFTNEDSSKIISKHPSVYASSIQVKMNKLINLFLKSKQCSLSAEYYHFRLFFEADAKVVARGILWPEDFKELNESVNDQDVFTNVIGNFFYMYILYLFLYVLAVASIPPSPTITSRWPWPSTRHMFTLPEQ